MRDYKFRGKRQDIGWKYGWLTTFESTLDGKIPAIKPFDEDYITYGVDPKSVGEFTGLSDKNNKEYFESDIMQWTQNDYISKRLEKVIWHDAGWWIADIITGDLLILLTNKEAVLRTIIGNLYDNPELLNGEVK
jgi:uncharacterized phage protein (TIGR01671 family)